MNIIDLDGNRHNWNLTGNIAKARIHDKSSFHLVARQLLIETYPTLQILEEVPIQLRKSETLYLDFFLPLIKTAIEVHGQQHYEFIPFYHGNRMSFLKAQKKDREKEEWCLLNGLKFVALPYNETVDQWKNKIYEQQNI
jgi:hypothetical protein